MISKNRGNFAQIQFSLKLIYEEASAVTSGLRDDMLLESEPRR